MSQISKGHPLILICKKKKNNKKPWWFCLHCFWAWVIPLVAWLANFCYRTHFRVWYRNFPGGPVVKTPRSQCKVTGLIPVQGTKVQHATWHSQNKLTNKQNHKHKMKIRVQCRHARVLKFGAALSLTLLMFSQWRESRHRQQPPLPLVTSSPYRSFQILQIYCTFQLSPSRCFSTGEEK